MFFLPLDNTLSEGGFAFGDGHGDILEQTGIKMMDTMDFIDGEDPLLAIL